MCRKQKENMKEIKISEKESLELISQMIKQSQKGVAEDAGMPFIAWGVIMMVVSIIIGLGIAFTENGHWMWGYFAIPILGFLYNFITKRRMNNSEAPRVKTYIEDTMEQVWKGIGMILIGYPIILLILRIDQPKAWIGMFFLGVFLPILGSYLMGLLLKMKELTRSMIFPLYMSLMLLSDLMMNNTMTNKYNFYFALFALFSMVLPGIIINKKAKEDEFDKICNS